MGFSLPNPGLFEMYWIGHMNHCQLDVEMHPQTMGGKKGTDETDKGRNSFKLQKEAKVMSCNG